VSSLRRVRGEVVEWMPEKTVQIYPSEKRRATRGPVARECLALSVDMEPGWKGSCVVPL
jgi:hypothetical protein